MKGRRPGSGWWERSRETPGGPYTFVWQLLEPRPCHGRGFSCRLPTPDHLSCLLRNLYVSQETTVKSGHGITDWFKIRKAVCQVCMLSTHSSILARKIPIDREAWWATVHGVSKSWMWLKWVSMHEKWDWCHDLSVLNTEFQASFFTLFFHPNQDPLSFLFTLCL